MTEKKPQQINVEIPPLKRGNKPTSNSKTLPNGSVEVLGGYQPTTSERKKIVIPPRKIAKPPPTKP
jgi:hypothetical protein